MFDDWTLFRTEQAEVWTPKSPEVELYFCKIDGKVATLLLLRHLLKLWQKVLLVPLPTFGSYLCFTFSTQANQTRVRLEANQGPQLFGPQQSGPEQQASTLMWASSSNALLPPYCLHDYKLLSQEFTQCHLVLTTESFISSSLGGTKFVSATWEIKCDQNKYQKNPIKHLTTLTQNSSPFISCSLRWFITTIRYLISPLRPDVYEITEACGRNDSAQQPMNQIQLVWAY